MADLDSLSDAEIRKKLAEYNFPAAAITSTTRKVYINKLRKLMDESNVSLNDAPIRSSARFSSGESSDDELKKPATRSKKNTPSKVITPVKTTRRRSTGRVASGNYNGESHTLSSDEQLDNDPIPDSKLANTSQVGLDRSSLFFKVSSRRSLHPDLDLSSNKSNHFTAYENGHNADLEGINRSSFSSSRLSRKSLDNSVLSPSSSSSFAQGGFKSRFLNSDIVSSVTAKSLSDYDNNFMSELRNRSGIKPTSTSYFGRLGNVELNNVKESDDEDQIPVSTTQSTFNNWQRQNKSRAVDSPWWKNSSLVSMGLLGILAVFFLMIALIYLGVTRKDAAISTPDTNFPVCRGNAGSECIKHEDIRPLMEIFRQIYHELRDHVVNSKCDDLDRKTTISLRQLGQHLISNGKINVWDFEQHADQNLQLLIRANPQWGIEIDNDLLDIPQPDLPMSCTFRSNFVYLLWLSVKLGLLVVGGVCCYKAGEWWLSRKDEHKRHVFRLVEQIIALVSAHAQTQPQENFLAINHVRDQLIPPQQRNSMQSVWEEAVAYVESKESRMRTEVQLVAGEEFRVWRWVGGSGGVAGAGVVGGKGGGRKVWQGQAFETMEGSVNSLPVSPTPCLKIRHMFDPDLEVGEGWMTQVTNAILEKCENVKVIHVAVDRGSSEGCVYLKCSSPEEAGKAYRALHGSWFDSKLVTVKYLRVERYHQRFPDAQRCSAPLRPSNNYRSSLPPH